MSTLPVYAIVPAAGLGKRFRAGRARIANEGSLPEHEWTSDEHLKQLATVNGQPMLTAAIDALDASRVAGTVVVVNLPIAEDVRSVRPPTTRRGYVINAHPEGEMIESVQMGIAEIHRRWSPKAAGHLVCPGDHPCITQTDIDACIAAFETSPDRLIIASFNGRRGHPVILPPDLADLVRNWPATRRLNELRELYADRVALVDTGDPGVLVDVDTPEDLEHAAALRGRGST